MFPWLMKVDGAMKPCVWLDQNWLVVHTSPCKACIPVLREIWQSFSMPFAGVIQSGHSI